MAVQVKLERQGGPVRWVEHAEARAIAVAEGHLYVTNNSGPTAEAIAIYTPGTWASAVVGDTSVRTLGEPVAPTVSRGTSTSS